MALNINSITLVGELTEPPRSRMTAEGKAVTRLRLAVDREFDRGTPDFFTVLAWQRLAELSGDILAECTGLPVSVKGKIRRRELPPKDGCRCVHRIYEVHADEIGFPSVWMREANELRRARRT